MQGNLKQRLAIATGAVSAAALPVGADAAIVYQATPITRAFQNSANTPWDVDGDGQTDFSLGGTTNWVREGSANIALGSNGLNGRGLVGSSTGGNAVDPLNSGFLVKPVLASHAWGKAGVYHSMLHGSRSASTYTVQRTHSHWTQTRQWYSETDSGLWTRTASGAYSQVSNGGRWTVRTAGITVHSTTTSTQTKYDTQTNTGRDFNGALGSNFIGFRFLVGADTHYGWAQLTLFSDNSRHGSATINRWAYEGTADCRIAVGQTSGDNCQTQVPAPPTLALLAAGAFGIRRWRRTRPAA